MEGKSPLLKTCLSSDLHHRHWGTHEAVYTCTRRGGREGWEDRRQTNNSYKHTHLQSKFSIHFGI